MLKLPTNAGEWGFVFVLGLCFSGLAFAVIYSQVHLRNMNREQAVRDTESNLYVIAEHVRRYQQRHGRIEPTLMGMEVPPGALRTRNADISNDVAIDGDGFRLSATLIKYSQPTCQCKASFKEANPEFEWTP
jgi:hypothetical protein